MDLVAIVVLLALWYYVARHPHPVYVVVAEWNRREAYYWRTPEISYNAWHYADDARRYVEQVYLPGTPGTWTLTTPRGPAEVWLWENDQRDVVLVRRITLY